MLPGVQQPYDVISAMFEVWQFLYMAPTKVQGKHSDMQRRQLRVM
jgi:hypothetical protein